MIGRLAVLELGFAYFSVSVEGLLLSQPGCPPVAGQQLQPIRQNQQQTNAAACSPTPQPLLLPSEGISLTREYYPSCSFGFFLLLLHLPLHLSSSPPLHLSSLRPLSAPHLCGTYILASFPLLQITITITVTISYDYDLCVRLFFVIYHYYFYPQASTCPSSCFHRLFTTSQKVTRESSHISSVKLTMRSATLRSLALYLFLSISSVSLAIANPAYEWPAGVDPSAKYWPDGTGPPKRWLQEFADAFERNQSSAKCTGVRKTSSEDPSEKFYWDWEHEARSQQGFLGGDSSVEKRSEGTAAEVPANAFKAPHRNFVSDNGIIRVLLGKRQNFACATGTYSCTSIGVPGSCCASDETCERIPDIGFGNVGCCPSGLSPLPPK